MKIFCDLYNLIKAVCKISFFCVNLVIFFKKLTIVS